MGPRWKKYTLFAAGVYNLVWGGFAVLFPLTIFNWLAMPAPNYPELWQCIGMIVGVYGVGYLIAATDPNRHWPIVLVGLLGKIFGPIGFLSAASQGRLPWNLGWTILTNDVIWWIPFALILKGAHDASLGRRRVASPEIIRMSLRTKTHQGMSLLEMSRRWPTLVVFLRHFGCTFCREALADLANARAKIEESGVRLVLVHMGTEEQAEQFFRRYQLEDVARISDTNQALYRAFGLTRGSLSKLFGPKVWWRGFQAGVLEKHGVGTLVGDGFQMPGVFLLYHGEVIRSYRHQSAADRPDYIALSAPVTQAEAV
ncbi:MAG: AhpC/TSA family protein [Bryobacteraceae bacterium]|nr:AhpC/TSA family protein [Bryobacteraceae bacterium]MDW8379302.1 peroxiredoxin-like family protein [Bryobacterales bacterium]